MSSGPGPNGLRRRLLITLAGIAAVCAGWVLHRLPEQRWHIEVSGRLVPVPCWQRDFQQPSRPVVEAQDHLLREPPLQTAGEIEHRGRLLLAKSGDDGPSAAGNEACRR